MIDTRTHGITYYVTGLLLIVAACIFGFATGGVGQWLPQVIGAAIIVMSLITRYELSIAKSVPLKQCGRLRSMEDCLSKASEFRRSADVLRNDAMRLS